MNIAMEAKMAKTEAVEEVTKSAKERAKEARQSILTASKPKVEYAELKGIELELRQPTLTEFLTSNTSGERDATRLTIEMVVKYSYLRDTDEHIFEPSDIDSLMSLPMSGEWLNLIQKMNDLLDIKVEDQVKN